MLSNLAHRRLSLCPW